MSHPLLTKLLATPGAAAALSKARHGEKWTTDQVLARLRAEGWVLVRLDAIPNADRLEAALDVCQYPGEFRPCGHPHDFPSHCPRFHDRPHPHPPMPDCHPYQPLVTPEEVLG